LYGGGSPHGNQPQPPRRRPGRDDRSCPAGQRLRRRDGQTDHPSWHHHDHPDGDQRALTATTTATGPLTDSELAWLNVPTKLRQTTTKVLTQGQSQVTRAMLEQWVSTLRSCSRELARLGAPSARLQPVYVLVKQACQQYDKGAACFAKAAPLINSTSRVREVQQAMDCGSAAINKGSELLADAEVKGIEIRTAG
jgi:hypothetical protein